MYNEFEYDDYRPSGEPQGGELAASLSPAMRMELIQKGYDPMDPADVKAFKNRQKPTGGLAEVAGVNSHKSLGDHGTFIDGKHITYNDRHDYGILSKEGKDVIDYEKMNHNVDPRQEMGSRMGGYGDNFGGDVNDRIMNKLGSRQQPTPQRQPQRQMEEQPQRTRGAIAQPKSLPQQKAQPQLLTEATKANKLGYTKGIKYINAFIENIKNPNNANRENLILEMNKMVSIEEKIHPSVLQAYRNGIASAEAELYKKIKSK